MNALSRVLIGIFAVVCLTACIAVPGCAGTLTLTSNPSGAEYTLTLTQGDLSQGSYSRIGFTPATLEGLPAGSYHLVLHCDGYVDEIRDLPIGGDNSYLSFDWQFTSSNQATLNINTYVDGTSMLGGVPIYIDNAYVGSTSTNTGSLSISVSLGSHEVKGTYNGQDVIQSFTVISGESKVVDMSFRGFSGKIDVTSTPSGASVYVDDNRVGITPCTVSVSSGEHTVSVSLTDYATMSTTVTVTDGKTEYLNFPLSKATGSSSFEIRTNPAADVYLDGEYRGTDSLIVTSGVKPGMHKIRIEKEGYEPYYEEINAESGQTNKLSVTLKEYVEGVSPVEEKPLGRTGLSVYTDIEASVSLDKKSLGKTPVVNYIDRDLTAGEHNLVLRVSGEQIPVKIVLEGGVITEFSYTLSTEIPTPVQTGTPVVTEIPTQPTTPPVIIETTAVPTQTTQAPASPAPLSGILAGLAACALVLRRR
ncbi:MAG TPA: PEGA domain-containing protein [Methanocorpusculum sp.]|nr:PEGA domain-containing protein [Methanocorpusculum sp.]